jgi:tetratricopeptide (TPR) repeat protein
MKKISLIVILLGVFTCTPLFAQKNKGKVTAETKETAVVEVKETAPEVQKVVSPKESMEYRRQLMVYNLATKYNDIAVAKTALYNLLAIDPTEISLLDSLAYYYFDYQQYAPAIIVAKDILSFNPNHLPAIEICAIGFENLGLLDQSVNYYESLYLKNNQLFNLYKVAYLQYNLKRFKESSTSADIIIAMQEADNLKLIFPTSDKSQQEIPMKAALFNLKGMISKDQGDKVNAKKNFEEALKIAPDFYLVKESLKQLK